VRVLIQPEGKVSCASPPPIVLKSLTLRTRIKYAHQLRVRGVDVFSVEEQNSGLEPQTMNMPYKLRISQLALLPLLLDEMYSSSVNIY